MMKKAICNAILLNVATLFSIAHVATVDSSFRYETYVSGELVSYIDEHYKTIRSRNGWGITGLSMGGHGAIYPAFRHPDVFGAVGSISGGVDIRPFPNNWEMPAGWAKKKPIRRTGRKIPSLT